MPFCRSIYMTKVMKLLAFIFEQPSYLVNYNDNYRLGLDARNPVFGVSDKGKDEPKSNSNISYISE